MIFHGQRPRATRNLFAMPKAKTIERARRDKREGKAASTQAGEFVRRNRGHSQGRARRPLNKAGHRHRPLEGSPRRGEAAGTSEGKGARRDAQEGQTRPRKGGERVRAKAVAKKIARHLESAQTRRSLRCLKGSLSKQARAAARNRSSAERSASAKKAARTRALH